MPSSIKFAIVGYGRIGKRYAEIIQANPSCDLVSVIDIKPKEDAGFHHEGIPYFNNLEEFISAKIPCDVAVVSTPNGYHFKMAKTVLENGFHAVVEKPVALASAEVDELIKVSVSHGKHLFSVMQNRYSPPSVWLKEVIEQNILGEIFMVQVNCFWNRDERYYTPDSWHGASDLDGGTLFTQFSHFLDIMLWLFGEISNISGKFADFNHKDLTDFEDSGFVSFDFKNGGIGTFNYSTSVWNSNLESSITIIAENGSVKVGGQYMDKVEACHIKNYQMPDLQPTNPGNAYLHYKGSASNHQYFIENLVQVINKGAEKTVQPEESRLLIRTINEIYKIKEKNFSKVK